MADVSEELSELEGIFRSTDAIMRPDIKTLLVRYASLHGDIGQIWPELVRHYKGYPALIDIVARELEGLSIEPSAEISRQVQSSLKEIFRVDAMDALLLRQRSPPKWLSAMLHSPLWIPTILDLAREYPKSFFVGYCLDRIALDTPEAVTRLPPGLVTYQAYSRVLKCYLRRLVSDRDLLKDFIEIIVTDDLTITHAAFVCHQMDNPDLAVKVDDQLQSRPAFRGLFNQIMLRLDNCDEVMIELLTSTKGLTPALISAIEGKCDGSSFLRYLIGKKIKGELFRSNIADDVVASAVRCLSALGRETRLQPDDVQYIAEAVKLLKRPQRLLDPLNLALVLRALEVSFFVDAALPELLRLIQREELTEFTRLSKSIETLMLCEVAYKHQDLCGRITDGIFKYLGTVNSGEHIRELYEVLWFLAAIGYAPEILARLMETFPINAKSQAKERRKFLQYFLERANPPFTAAFVRAFTRCIAQENFRCLVIADSGSGPLAKQVAKSVVGFLDKVERSGVSGVDDETAQRLQELRAGALRVVG